MSAPRQVLPGTTYLVTRRCAHRQFLLRPCRLTNEIFLYLLALGARRYGIRIHAFCVLSNHYHLLLTDPDARLPAFCQFVDALVARALNASLGRWEAFWAPSSYSAVALATPGDILDKAAYVLANPVAAGLVRSARSWPGLWSSPESLGRTIRAPRPEGFFSARGCLPPVVDLPLTAPPGFSSAEEFGHDLASALSTREAAERPGKAFLGAGRVLRQRPDARPTTNERRGGVRPRVAALDRWKRLERLEQLASFLQAYREAWGARQAGEPSVLFPAGTYLLRVLHGVACAAPG